MMLRYLLNDWRYALNDWRYALNDWRYALNDWRCALNDWRCARHQGRSRAFTVVEMLITLAIFGVVLTLAGQVALAAFRHNAVNSHNAVVTRQGAVVLDSMSREMRQCENILWPNTTAWKNGCTYQSSNQSSSAKTAASKNLLLAWQRRVDDEVSIVGYRYLAKDAKLERLIFPANYKFTSASVEEESRLLKRETLLEGVSAFTFGSRSLLKSCGQPCFQLSFTIVPGWTLSGSSAQQASKAGTTNKVASAATKASSGLVFSFEVQIKEFRQ